jgi:uncharacterized protein (TIGR01244 family)
MISLTVTAIAHLLDAEVGSEVPVAQGTLHGREYPVRFQFPAARSIGPRSRTARSAGKLGSKRIDSIGVLRLRLDGSHVFKPRARLVSTETDATLCFRSSRPGRRRKSRGRRHPPPKELRAASTPPVDPAAIPNYRIVAPSVASAGRPTADGLQRLRALGFRTVIDLRTDAEEGVAEEEEIVREQGLRYARIPVTPASLRPADVEAVAKLIDDPSAGPVLLHCSSANRTGGVWAVIQATRRGTSLDEALEVGRKAGLRSEAMIEAVRRVIGEAAPASPPPGPR